MIITYLCTLDGTGLDVTIVDVSCGAKHTTAVSFIGDVYCWGDSLSGQCGMGKLGKFPEPQLVPVTERTHSCQHDATENGNSNVFIQVSTHKVHLWRQK